VSWHDTAKRNISLERIVMLMSGILVEPSCICAAHMLMPLNIVRIPNKQHTILVNPIIIVISDNSSSICFNNNLFQNTHRHRGNAKEASPSDTRHKTMEHKTVLCVGNTKLASAVGSALTDDKQNVKTSKALTHWNPWGVEPGCMQLEMDGMMTTTTVSYSPGNCWWSICLMWMALD
jgi:hypothetical protein